MAAAEGIPCGTLNEGAERLSIYIRSTGMDGKPVDNIRNAPVWGLLACGQYPQCSGMGSATIHILRCKYGDRPRSNYRNNR